MARCDDGMKRELTNLQQCNLMLSRRREVKENRMPVMISPHVFTVWNPMNRRTNQRTDKHIFNLFGRRICFFSIHS
jgi:hypothetical protein